MAQQGHIPKFGNWEGGEQALYTAYFDNVRKNKNTGRWINPNDPQQNQQAFSQSPPPAPEKPQPVRPSSNRIAQSSLPAPAPAPEKLQTVRASSDRNAQSPPPAPAPEKPQPVRGASDRNALKGKHGPWPSKGEDAEEVVGFSESTARKVFDEMPQRGKGRRMSAGSDRSVEQSPLHHQQQQQRRTTRAGPGHGITSRTPPRNMTRQLSLSIHDTEEIGTPVPKFGEWDESNPASADNYTELFGIMKHEKETGLVRVPITNKQKPSHHNQHHHSNSLSKCCPCFGWLKN